MHSRRITRFISATLIFSTLFGCHGVRTLYYWDVDKEQDRLQYYKHAATEIAYPNVDEPIEPSALMTERPRTIRDLREQEVWNMRLAEALHIALENNKIIRTRTAFLSPNNPLLAGVDRNPSIWDPAIQETNFLFGSRGVEAALAAFDTQLTTSMIWSRNETMRNNQFTGAGITPGRALVQDGADFNIGLQKNFATGSLLRLAHDWNYQWDNAPSGTRLFPSSYTGFVRADYRQPLLAGAGTEFTRIAGPIAQNFGGITGVSQGVVIARINTDISIADFEQSVQNLARDVEDLYWDLYLAYRQYDAEVIARNAALRTWREVNARAEIGAEGGGAAEVAQARENYFDTRARVESALANLYSLELQLRRLIGLPVSDGRVIRPLDEPLTAEFIPEWHVSLAEALTERVELRRQKWNIKSLELQAVAAKSLTRPRLDFVSAYQVNGFGDRLFGSDDDDEAGTAAGLNSAYEVLTQGDLTGWQLGFEFTMPIGFRSARAQLHNIELRLAKARAGLAAQELEISHELASAFVQMDAAYTTAQTNFNRRRAAQLRVQAFEAEYRAGTSTLDLLLRAQASLAAAEIAYFTSLIRYNQAIADLHQRKGTLLEHNSIYLAESEWTPVAYRQALRRAWSRTYAFDASRHLYTEPGEFELPGQPQIMLVPEHGVETIEPGAGPLPPAPEIEPLAPPAEADEPETPIRPISASSVQPDFFDRDPEFQTLEDAVFPPAPIFGE